MQRITGSRRLAALLPAVLVSLVLAGCGSSSDSGATSLLKQTFSGPHKVNSGNLDFSLVVTPSGSSTLTGPISLSFGGPFQSLGKGKLPESNFTVSLGANGHAISLAILSTGTAGYITLSGSSYQLPASSFQKLESSFASIASPVGGGSGKSTLSRLGINPLGWLTDASVVGTDTVGGAATTHIRAKVNVPALLRDLSKLLSKASSLGVSATSAIPTSISAATQAKIAQEVQNPSFDLWTGTSDKTVRKLVVGLTLPVTGQTSTLLGGMKSAQIALTLQYGDLNQPQTITAPKNIQPYSQFTSKIQTLLAGVETSIAGGALGGAGTTGSSGSTGSSGATGSTGSSGAGSSSGAPANYTQCIQQAGQDISKMQQCASLLGSGG